MQPKNKLLELFEPPMSLGDVTRCAIAYIEHYFRGQQIKVVYYCVKVMFSDHISAYARYDLRANTIETHNPGWHGQIWIGLSKSKKHPGINDSPQHPLKDICIYTHNGGGGGSSGIPPFMKDRLNPLHKITDYCNPWSWDISMFLDDFPSLKMLKLLKPDSPEYRLTFNKDKTVFSHYTNAPWHPDEMFLSKNKAAWLQSDEFYERLVFTSSSDQPPAGLTPNLIVLDDVLEN